MLGVQEKNCAMQQKIRDPRKEARERAADLVGAPTQTR
jgi:hypothetical protein